LFGISWECDGDASGDVAATRVPENAKPALAGGSAVVLYLP
jgi:hypothetical protein